jgi:hypothetical protein
MGRLLTGCSGGLSSCMFRFPFFLPFPFLTKLTLLPSSFFSSFLLSLLAPSSLKLQLRYRCPHVRPLPLLLNRFLPTHLLHCSRRMSLIVSPNNPRLVSGASDASASPWVLGMEAAGIKVLPHIVKCVLAILPPLLSTHSSRILRSQCCHPRRRLLSR